ncbi:MULTISPECIES: GT4 family glycosyltransferase PelF [unclassified Paenibacillus]|uniref:GT4 family glycosyltransferase PelF n=1 Tax=unclassified Paenibacillus TaxID=185978 RepID=UPI001AE909F7|nr:MULTISPECIES: GT4 family glycosyltransferase PelF [unclassified Paenibacillus]MBP1154239.1 glycosyltransferase involved in cell wall biosynthesis [Paenibacillus sp. PvP091]MBP1170376.1 glycosyltransferase involved in cell wall biosynthesis [Paenibacillus sp. PvR098]MBP2441404.1 glycosyltransferase involved in cell wall biosynthesis [Paenibacillus sp. PvP052]
MKNKLTVMLLTEGTYPYFQGGVSTWCDILVKQLSMVDYVIFSVVADPFITPQFEKPQNTQITQMPLWGTEEPCEHLKIPFSQVYLSKKRTVHQVVKKRFIPLFSDLIKEIISSEKNPTRFGQILYELNQYFSQYEYKESFKAEITWDIYKDIILSACKDTRTHLPEPDIYGMIQSLGWIYRFFNILNNPIPKVHVSHSSAAAFCGIPAVLAKMAHKTPLLLTEHGVYLREQYLSLSKRGLSSFLNTFLIRLVSSIVSLNYTFADQVSPVCEYNTRWESRLGVEPSKINVIYNGVDEQIFREGPIRRNEHPTVVTVARIDPNKDILTLVQAAFTVKQQIPDVRFVIHGSVAVQEYYEECLALRDKLDLNETIIFAGHTQNMAAAYQSGDVVALSSMTEAFPYAVVEGMMTAKPVVATDVGGIREALGDTGFVVTPGRSEALADKIIVLLKDPELRNSLGKRARERALHFLTLDKVLENYLKSYIKLSIYAHENVPAARGLSPEQLQKLHAEQAYILMSRGYYQEAAAQFRSAVNMLPAAVFTPVLIGEIAVCYERLGDRERASMELERMKLLMQLAGNKRLNGGKQTA